MSDNGLGFWLAWANADGSRNTASEFQLQPAPALVRYPQEAIGSVIETPDGVTIQQQPNRDGRVRQWVWKGYPSWYEPYRALWRVLEGTRAKFRREMNESPYIYLREDQSELFRQQTWRTATTTASGTQTFADSTASFVTGALIGAEVEFPTLGKRGTINANTATSFTIAQAITAVPSGTKYILKSWASTWMRCRVMDVSRVLRENSDTVYEESLIKFAVDDPNFPVL